MDHRDKIKEYFKECIPLLGANKDKVLKLMEYLPEEYYNYPAASGNHHSELQAKKHGLLYHVWEGFWTLDQLIRSRSDIIERFSKMEDYEGTDPKSDLYTAYFLHDILKYRVNPSGSNYTHDEDCYQLLKDLGFNTVVCQIVRFTHGQWSTAVVKYHKNFKNTKYEDLIWLSHYSDMAASRMNDVKLILESDGTAPAYDKTIMQNRKENPKDTDNIEWWKSIKLDENEVNPTEELEDSF